jgi:hypothetical protein
VTHDAPTAGTWKSQQPNRTEPCRGRAAIAVPRSMVVPIHQPNRCRFRCHARCPGKKVGDQKESRCRCPVTGADGSPGHSCSCFLPHGSVPSFLRSFFPPKLPAGPASLRNVFVVVVDRNRTGIILRIPEPHRAARRGVCIRLISLHSNGWNSGLHQFVCS